MKSYDILADYYDEIIIDEEGILKWADFTDRYSLKGKTLELAAGSGAISMILKQRGYDLCISDLSEKMLQKANIKMPDVPSYVIDMRHFSLDEQFDNVLCYNDSINYLLSEEDLKNTFECVYKTLKPKGRFLFDVHTIERLNEFEEEFIEEDQIDDVAYQWSIASEGQFLCHHLTFWLKDGIETEEHIQYVFDKETIKRYLEESGFSYKVYTDFEYDENTEGEKWYFVATKE